MKVLRRAVATAVAAVLGLGTSIVVANLPQAAATISNSESDVVVKVGGTRQGASADKNVSGINGVWLGLYTSATGGQMVFRAKSASANMPASATDTVGTPSDGVVRFHLTEAGRLDPAKYEGRPDNIFSSSTKLYLRALEPGDLPAGETAVTPAGWHFVKQLATNSGTAIANTQSQAYAFPVPQGTGGLTANRLYLAGYTNTGNNTSTQSTQGFMNGSGSNQTASGGVFTIAADNAAMPTTCKALNVALILDTSASVKEDSTNHMQTQLKEAATQLVSAFTNTGLSLQLFTFGTNAVSRTDLTLLTPQGATNIKSQISKITNSDFSGQWTNWDAALYALQPQSALGLARQNTKYDVAIFLTDGLPTTYAGDGGTGKSQTTGISGTTGSGTVMTDFIRSERAIQSANLLKQNGTHIEVLGIGDANDSKPARLNLAAVSDDNSVTTESWDKAARALRYSVLKPCLPSLTVTKYERPWDAPDISVWDDAARTRDMLAAGWDFTISDMTENTIKLDPAFFPNPAKDENDNQYAVERTDDSGSVFFKLAAVNEGKDTFDPDRELGSLTLAETQQEGWNIVQQSSETDPTLRNAQCVYISQYTTDQAINSKYGGDVVGTRPSWVDSRGVIHFTEVPAEVNTTYWVDAAEQLHPDARPTQAPANAARFGRKVPWIDLSLGGSTLAKPSFRIVDMAVTDMVRCTMINQAMKPLEIVVPEQLNPGEINFKGKYVADYEWAVEKVVDRNSVDLGLVSQDDAALPADEPAETAGTSAAADFNYQLNVTSKLRSEGRAFDAEGEVEIKNPNPAPCEAGDENCNPKLAVPLSLAGVNLEIAGSRVDNVTWTASHPAPCGVPLFFPTPGWVENGKESLGEVSLDYLRSPNSTELPGTPAAFCDEAGLPVPVSDDGHVVAITRSADWGGLATEPGLLQPEHTYRFALRARTADGAGDQPLRFVAHYLDAEGGEHWDWINPTTMSEAWHNFSGTWRVPAGATEAQVYLGSGPDGATDTFTYYVDDLTVAEVTTFTPQVTSQSFDDESLGAYWTASGSAGLAFVDGGADGAGKALSIVREHDWDGIETVLGVVQPGTSYEFSMKVRTADGVGATRVRFVGNSPRSAASEQYVWIGDTLVNDQGWTTVSGAWVTPSTGADGQPLTERDLKVYLGSTDLGGAYQLLVDDIVVRRLSTGGTAHTLTTADAEPASYLSDIIVAPGQSVLLPLRWTSDERPEGGVEASLSVPYRYLWPMPATEIAASSNPVACPDASMRCYTALRTVDIPNPNTQPLPLSEVDVLVDGVAVAKVGADPVLTCPGQPARKGSRVLADNIVPPDCQLSIDLTWTGQPLPSGSVVRAEIVINKRASMNVTFDEAPVLENTTAYITDLLTGETGSEAVAFCDAGAAALGVTCDADGRGAWLNARAASSWTFNYSKSLAVLLPAPAAVDEADSAVEPVETPATGPAVEVDPAVEEGAPAGYSPNDRLETTGNQPTALAPTTICAPYVNTVTVTPDGAVAGDQPVAAMAGATVCAQVMAPVPSESEPEPEPEPEVCKWDESLTADDAACVEPQPEVCEWDDQLTADDAACIEPTPEPEDPTEPEPTDQCESNVTLRAADPACGAIEYDAALRVWGQRIYRQNEAGQWVEVYQYRADAPTHPLPYLGYDDPDIHLQYGDAVQYAIQVTNQGSDVTRINSLTFHTAPGVVLAQESIHQGETNVGWAVEDVVDEAGVASQNWYYQVPANDLVLPPGASDIVMVTGIVTENVQTDDEGKFESFAEISGMSGLRPDVEAVQARRLELEQAQTGVADDDAAALGGDIVEQHNTVERQVGDSPANRAMPQSDGPAAVPDADAALAPEPSSVPGDQASEPTVASESGQDEPTGNSDPQVADDQVGDVTPAQTAGSDQAPEVGNAENSGADLGLDMAVDSERLAFAARSGGARALFASFTLPVRVFADDLGALDWVPVDDIDSDMGTANQAVASFDYETFDNVINDPADVDNHDSTRALLVAASDSSDPSDPTDPVDDPTNPADEPDDDPTNPADDPSDSADDPTDPSDPTNPANDLAGVCPSNHALAWDDAACQLPRCPFNRALSAGDPACVTPSGSVGSDPKPATAGSHTLRDVVTTGWGNYQSSTGASTGQGARGTMSTTRAAASAPAAASTATATAATQIGQGRLSRTGASLVLAGLSALTLVIGAALIRRPARP